MVAKTLLLESEGYKVYAVNGKEARRDFSVTFIGGTNWKHSEDVPDREYWLEDSMDHEDQGFILLHELVETEIMDELKLGYDDAHPVANTVEAFARKTGDIAEAVASAAEAMGLANERRDRIIKIHSEFCALEKEAAEDLPVYLGGTPKGPEAAPEKDPYAEYISGTMANPRGRENLFDLASGTRWKGPRGLAERWNTGLGEYGRMSDAGVSPWDEGFSSRMSGAVHNYFKDPAAVEQVFGRTMKPVEAISTLGVSDLVHAKAMASDPVMWSKAFGKAAKTPAEQAHAKKFLHAALSLNAFKSGLGFDKNQFQATWAGVPKRLQQQFHVPRVPTGTAAGTKMQPDFKALLQQPILNPEIYTDKAQALDLMDKMSAEDLRQAKIAADLEGTFSTAKYPKDSEPHLYHVEKRDGDTVGMVKVAPKDSGAVFKITNFWVKPGYRSQGIGSSLFKKIIELYGHKKLVLDSEVFDKSPLTQPQLDKFYEKHGFKKGKDKEMTRVAGGEKPVEKAALEKEAVGLPGLLGAVKNFGHATAPAVKAFEAPVGREITLAKIMAKLRRGAPGHAGKLNDILTRHGVTRSIDELESGGFTPKPGMDLSKNAAAALPATKPMTIAEKARADQLAANKVVSDMALVGRNPSGTLKTKPAPAPLLASRAPVAQGSIP